MNAAATANFGTEQYHGSVIDRRGGALQPLSYARELARVACARGASICAETTVTRMTPIRTGWQVHCQSGASVSASHVLLCTNAYSDALVPELANSFIAANSLQIATSRFQMNCARHHASWRSSVRYAEGHSLWRLDDHGRLLMGGRGPYREPDSEADWAHLIKDIATIFPMLAHLRCTHRWAGRVAIYIDFMPHFTSRRHGS